jgi:hypothetical protein
MIRKCLQCQKGFAPPPGNVRRGKGKFCSRFCAYTWQFAQEATIERITERFFANVNVDGPVPAHVPEIGPCHVWTGRTNEFGYGKFSMRGAEHRAHRVAFFLAESRWPDPCALHRCDNPACVRRDHLFEGTKKDNSADMVAKKRSGAHTHPEKIRRGERHWSKLHPDRVPRGDANGARLHPERLARGERSGARLHPERVPRGEANGSSKLTETQVLEIRAATGKDALLRVLAARFGVTEALVSMIRLRKIWRHV